jgi:hypothetical protein
MSLAKSVGWAKARSAVPTVQSITRSDVGTLRFAHPTVLPLRPPEKDSSLQSARIGEQARRFDAGDGAGFILVRGVP